MKTNKLYYEVFQEFPDIFFRLIGKSQVNARAYEFKAIELKETSLRLDGVMLRVAKNLKEPIYFIEVQSYKNDDIYPNILRKVSTYLEQNDAEQNWFGVVIYERRSLEPENAKSYKWLFNSGKILRIYLDEIDLAAQQNLGIGLVKLIVEKEKNAVSLAKQLIGQTRSESTDDEQTSKMLELIETIIVYKFADKSREELQAMLGLEDIKETKLGKNLLAEGWQKGRQEGRQEGEQIGRLKGKLDVAPVMLDRGFTFEEVAELFKLELDQVGQVTQPEKPSQSL